MNIRTSKAPGPGTKQDNHSGSRSIPHASVAPSAAHVTADEDVHYAAQSRLGLRAPRPFPKGWPASVILLRSSPLLFASALLTALAVLVVVIVPEATRAQDHQHQADELYQCVMHAQITSDGEGRCPLCKMFLKPVAKDKALAKLKAWEKKTGKKAPARMKGKKHAASQPASTAKTKHAGMAGMPGMATGKSARPAKATTSKPSKSKTPKTKTSKAGTGVELTCPMHTHVAVNGTPGDARCPICGMDLIAKDQLDAHAGMKHEHDTFICPMHPDIVNDEEGRCPLCGMDLVKKQGSATATANKRKEKESTDRKIKYWVGPMDPTYIRDQPGKSPMGMDLVPVYEDDGSSRALVKVDPVVVQNMGVRIARAERQPLFRHVRTLGTVDVAENEIAVVNLRFSGWIEKIYVDETGVKVNRGQRLAEVYSPELVSAQEEYLLALRTRGKEGKLAQSARRRLGFFGLGESDIKRLEEKGETLRTIRIRAPRAGYILHKDIVLGARVNAGQDIYRIGNLQKIWINAEVYEFDAPWIKLDAPATMELTFQQGKVYSGKVGYIYPTLNPKSRTLRVRLEFDNPGLALKPGMFATVRIESRRIDGALAIPTEAILHSGQRKIIFVALGGGRYNKREITTGLVADRYLTEVLSGVQEGERIVVSGQFLLDSESQLQEAVQKLLDARLESKSPGANLGASPAPAHDKVNSYFTCSMHPQVVEHEPGTCPICGMDLVERKR